MNNEILEVLMNELLASFKEREKLKKEGLNLKKLNFKC